jgi:hypothetical protein
MTFQKIHHENVPASKGAGNFFYVIDLCFYL